MQPIALVVLGGFVVLIQPNSFDDPTNRLQGALTAHAVDRQYRRTAFRCRMFCFSSTPPPEMESIDAITSDIKPSD
jgi:hypothetical protein